MDSTTSKCICSVPNISVCVCVDQKILLSAATETYKIQYLCWGEVTSYRYYTIRTTMALSKYVDQVMELSEPAVTWAPEHPWLASCMLASSLAVVYYVKNKVCSKWFQQLMYFFFHCLTLKVLVTTIDAQWEGMGDVGSAKYEPALLPPCPTNRVLSYSN